MSFSDRFLGLLVAGLALPILGFFLPEVLPLWGAYLLVVVLLAVVQFRQLPGRDGIDVRREAPERVVFGEPFPVEIVVDNLSRFPAWVEVRDTPPPDFEVDRPDGLARVEGRLPPGSSGVLRYLVTPWRRGTFEFEDLYARATSWPGLVHRHYRIPAARVCRSSPAGQPGGGLRVRRRRVFEQGMIASLRAGEGRDFDRLRDYVPGDDIRFMDWKATARRGKPTVRQFRLEQDQRIVAMLDTGRTMAGRVGRGTKLDLACGAIRGLAEAVFEQGDEMALVAFSIDVKATVPLGRGPRQMRDLVDRLSEVEAEPFASDYTAAFTYLERIVRRRSLVVVFTDVLDPDSSRWLIGNLARLAPRHLPVCVSVRDSDLEAAARGAAGGIRDLYRKVAAREILDEYQAALVQMETKGVLAVSVPAASLTVATVQRYLEAKYKGSL